MVSVHTCTREHTWVHTETTLNILILVFEHYSANINIPQIVFCIMNLNFNASEKRRLQPLAQKVKGKDR